MNKLGFTFYPKDWWTSETYFSLSPIQRYYYLECLFIMYTNDGYMKTQKTQLENRMRTQISDDDFYEVVDGFILQDGKYTSPTVNKRLRKTLANRENGKLGGRPKKDVEKPKKPSLETQKNPPSEREREREINNNINIDFNEVDVWIKKLSTQQLWLEGIYRLHKLQKGSVSKIAVKFKEHLKIYPEDHKTFESFKRHLSNWIRTQVNNNQLNEYVTQKQGSL